MDADLKAAREGVLAAMTPSMLRGALQGLQRLAAEHPDSEGIAETLKLTEDWIKAHDT